MSIVLTHQIISDANNVVTAYITKANTLFSDLDAIVHTLSDNAFLGDAANGFLDFYACSVVPALTENLTATDSSLMEGIKSMLNSIQEQLLDNVDQQLGEANRGLHKNTIVSHVMPLSLPSVNIEKEAINMDEK